MFFDTHAHYDAEEFRDDIDSLLASMPSGGVCGIVVPGCDLASSRRAVELAERYPYVWAAVGYHPEQAVVLTDTEMDALRALLRHPRVVAVGEVGLDAYWPENPAPEVQEQCLEQMFTLAAESGKPVIFHEREACAPSLEAVRRHPEVRGVFHCFSGSVETAKELVERGWYISFTGVLTFKNAKKAPEVAAWLPEDRIMIETDAPYMAPVPYRGKRNSSLYLPEIAAALAKYRGISPEEAAELTKRNAIRFFGLENDPWFKKSS